jgi:hypothetical protein
MNGAIAVSHLTNIFSRIKEKKTISEEELKKELTNSQLMLFHKLVSNTQGIRYNVKRKAFEVE